MKNVVVEFDEKEVFEKAKDYFIKICGFQLDKENHKRMLALGMESRKEGIGGIRIRAVLSSYGAEVFHDQKVVIGEIAFSCPAFEKIKQDQVKKIYTYLLTAGECSSSNADKLEKQVFSDIWGTAYTDSARDLMEGYIKHNLEQEFPGQLDRTLFLSDAFSPGIYGMDLYQTKDLFQVLDAERIGMQVMDSGLMLPLKSCSGLFFAVTDTGDLPHQNCRECIGSSMGCSFCRFRHERMKLQAGG